MRAVIQRVSSASVKVDGKITGEIEKGLLVLLGVKEGDTKKNADYLAEKIPNLRIFSDENDKMNLSLLDVKGEILVVSQFTLLGETKKGRRPSFINAAKPDFADELYEYFLEKVKLHGLEPETGVFQTDMKVSLVNDGPVTLIMDTDEK